MSSQRRTASRRWLYCEQCCGCSCTPMRIGKVTVVRLDANPPIGFPHRDYRRPRSTVAALRPARQRIIDAVVVVLAGMLDAHRDQIVGDDGTACLRAERHGEELFGLAAVRPLERDGEQPVVGVQRVAVGGDPQIAVAVEGQVVGAGDRADLALVESGEIGVGGRGIAADKQQIQVKVVPAWSSVISRICPLLLSLRGLAASGTASPGAPRSSLLVSATYTLPVLGLASKSSGRSILVAPALSAANRVNTAASCGVTPSTSDRPSPPAPDFSSGIHVPVPLKEPVDGSLPEPSISLAGMSLASFAT